MSGIIRPSGESLFFDGTLSEDWVEAAAVTDHPVESGATVSDHIHVLSRSFRLNCVMTASPLKVDGETVSVRREVEAKEFLIGCLGELVTVVTSRFGAVANCAITTVRHPVTARGAIEFAIDVRVVRIAQQESVAIPDSVVAPTARQLASSSDLGEQATTATADDARTDADKSFAVSILEGLGVL